MTEAKKPARKILTLKKKAPPPPAPPKEEHARLFVSVAVDPAWLGFRGKAARALAPGLKDLRHRFVSPQNLHLTVRFIGKVARADIGNITAAAAAAAAAHRPFVLDGARLIPSPRPNKPRMIWASFPHSPAFADLAASCEKALAPHLPPPEEKPKKYRDRTEPGAAPHITVAYLKKAKPPFYERPLVEAAIAAVRPSPPPLPVTEIRLMASELRSDAARYTLIQSFPLSAKKTKPAPKKAPAKKAAIKKAAAKKATVKKAAAKKATAKKTAAKKAPTPAKKAAAKKAAGKKAAVKKTAKPAVKKAAVKKSKPAAARKARKS